MAISRKELEEFYVADEARLFNFALRWTWNRSLAEEIVHDALIRIWERRDLVNGGTIRSLAFKTIQNLALNEIRKTKLREKVPLMDWLMLGAAESPEAEYAGKQELLNLEKKISRLPFELKEVLLLCEYSELSYSEIGKILKIPEGTVASRRNRAIHQMKEDING